MILGDEVMVLLLGVAVTIFAVKSKDQLKRLPFSSIIIGAFYALLAGWVLTVAEGLFWGRLLNTLEHICYATNAVLLCAWCWMATGKKEGQE
jgi:hypothetical protein